MVNDNTLIDYAAIIANLRSERATLIAKVEALTSAIRSLMQVSGRAGGEEEECAPPTPKVASGIAPEQLPVPIQKVLPVKRNVPIPRLPSDPNYEPPEVADDTWISIKSSSASPMAIGMAVLRSFPHTVISSASLNSRIAAIRKVEGGAGYTILEKLKENGVIATIHGESASVWKIEDASKGGVFKGDRLWSPPQHLSEYDWAAIRREGILELLNVNPALTIAGITKGLAAWEWYRAPVTDDLVKADLRALTKKGLVRRNDATKEWSLLKGKEAAEATSST